MINAAQLQQILASFQGADTSAYSRYLQA